MTERHEITEHVTPSGLRVISEEHEFVKSDTCYSYGLLGYVSMRCSLSYKGCDDRACVCQCHDDDLNCEHLRAPSYALECPDCGAELSSGGER